MQLFLVGILHPTVYDRPEFRRIDEDAARLSGRPPTCPIEHRWISESLVGRSLRTAAPFREMTDHETDQLLDASVPQRSYRIRGVRNREPRARSLRVPHY